MGERALSHVGSDMGPVRVDVLIIPEKSREFRLTHRDQTVHNWAKGLPKDVRRQPGKGLSVRLRAGVYDANARVSPCGTIRALRMRLTRRQRGIAMKRSWAVLLITAWVASMAPPGGLVVASGTPQNTFMVGKVLKGRVNNSSAPVINARDFTALGAVPRAQVEAVWLPGLATAEVGDAIKPIVVGQGTADANGNFDLSVNPTPQMLQEAATNDGWVNLQVAAQDADGSSVTTAVSRAWVNGHWSGKGRSDKDPAQRAQIPFLVDAAGKSLNASPALNARAADSSTTKASAAAGAGTSAAALGVTIAYGCQYVVTSTTRNSVRVTNFHNASNATGSWSYGTTADSDIDAGSKPYGAAEFSVSGNVHVGNSLSGSVNGATPYNYNAWTRTDFRFSQGAIQDYYGAPAGSQCKDSSLHVGDQTVNPSSWAGGVADDTGSGAEYRSCDTYPRYQYRGRYPKGTSLHINSSRATRIGFAADIGLLHVGGTSGYSTNVSLAWDSLRGNGVYLCGQTGDEVTDPGVIYSQNM